jgi:hypothetical protein
MHLAGAVAAIMARSTWPPTGWSSPYPRAGHLTIEREEELDAAELRVAARFCGPPGFANGGFASGSLAALLGGAAEVTLRRPVPLDRSLPVHRDGSALFGPDGEVLAAARTVWITVPRRAVVAAGGAGS